LAACQKTAIELGELVKRLSALARVGKETPAACVPLDAAAVLRECLHAFSARLAKAALTVKWEISERPLPAVADPILLRIVFNNLLDNAVSYAVPATEIRIRAAPAAGRVTVAIANRADPPPENPARLFEPLFRQGEASHPESAHLGICLTLSLESSVAMGGDLQGNVTGDEVEFVLQLLAAEESR
jgi:signal transduction histidine kinase